MRPQDSVGLDELSKRVAETDTEWKRQCYLNAICRDVDFDGISSFLNHENTLNLT